MSLPQISQNMFYIEGQTTAVLVTTKGAEISSTHVKFLTPVRALEWCVKNCAGFVYQPAIPNN